MGIYERRRKNRAQMQTTSSLNNAICTCTVCKHISARLRSENTTDQLLKDDLIGLREFFIFLSSIFNFIIE